MSFEDEMPPCLLLSLTTEVDRIFAPVIVHQIRLVQKIDFTECNLQT